MLDSFGRPRVLEAARQALGDREAPLDFGEDQNTAVRGQPSGVEGGDKPGRNRASSAMAGANSVDRVNAERTFLKSAEVNFPTWWASVIRCWREWGLWVWADGRGGAAVVPAAAA